MKRLLLVLGLMAWGSLAFGQDSGIKGTWFGSISLPAINMDVSVTLAQDEDGKWQGTIDIPSQGAKALPLTNIQNDKNKIVFAIEKVPGDPTFNGTLSQDGKRIEGDFTQNQKSFPFTLTRGPGR